MTRVKADKGGKVMEKTIAVNAKMVKRVAQSNRRGHVAIWLEVLRVAHRQWTEAEHGKFRASSR